MCVSGTERLVFLFFGSKPFGHILVLVAKKDKEKALSTLKQVEHKTKPARVHCLKPNM